MSEDLVARLRVEAWDHCNEGAGVVLMHRASDEIERLRGLLDRVLTQVRKTLTQELSDEIEAALGAADRDSATPPTP